MEILFAVSTHAAAIAWPLEHGSSIPLWVVLQRASCDVLVRLPEDVEDVKREIQILHHLGGHSNITQLKGVYEDRHNIHLVNPTALASIFFPEQVDCDLPAIA